MLVLVLLLAQGRAWAIDALAHHAFAEQKAAVCAETATEALHPPPCAPTGRGPPGKQPPSDVKQLVPDASQTLLPPVHPPSEQPLQSPPSQQQQGTAAGAQQGAPGVAAPGDGSCSGGGGGGGAAPMGMPGRAYTDLADRHEARRRLSSWRRGWHRRNKAKLALEAVYARPEELISDDDLEEMEALGSVGAAGAGGVGDVREPESAGASAGLGSGSIEGLGFASTPLKGASSETVPTNVLNDAAGAGPTSQPAADTAEQVAYTPAPANQTPAAPLTAEIPGDGVVVCSCCARVCHIGCLEAAELRDAMSGYGPEQGLENEAAGNHGGTKCPTASVLRWFCSEGCRDIVLAFDSLCVCGVNELMYPFSEGGPPPPTWPTHWQLVPIAPMAPTAEAGSDASPGHGGKGGDDGRGAWREEEEEAVYSARASLPPDVQALLKAVEDSVAAVGTLASSKHDQPSGTTPQAAATAAPGTGNGPAATGAPAPAAPPEASEEQWTQMQQQYAGSVLAHILGAQPAAPAVWAAPERCPTASFSVGPDAPSAAGGPVAPRSALAAAARAQPQRPACMYATLFWHAAHLQAVVLLQLFGPSMVQVLLFAPAAVPPPPPPPPLPLPPSPPRSASGKEAPPQAAAPAAADASASASSAADQLLLNVMAVLEGALQTIRVGAMSVLAAPTPGTPRGSIWPQHAPQSEQKVGVQCTARACMCAMLLCTGSLPVYSYSSAVSAYRTWY